MEGANPVISPEIMPESLKGRNAGSVVGRAVGGCRGAKLLAVAHEGSNFSVLRNHGEDDHGESLHALPRFVKDSRPDGRARQASATSPEVPRALEGAEDG